MGNGPNYGGYGYGPPPPRKTPLEIAKESRDQCLNDLSVAAHRLSKASEQVEKARKAQSPCTCTPGQCTNCGGTK